MGEATRAWSEPRQGTAGLRAGLATLVFVMAGCVTGGSGPAPDAAETARGWLREAPAPAGALVVRLAFDAGADLDLYVTGPLEETVYFANSPSKIGGRLEADLRCNAPEPRIETVVFPNTHPGRYRVGVDHPEACGPGREATAFAVELRSAAGVELRTGVVRRGEFEPIVFEWIEPGLAD